MWAAFARKDQKDQERHAEDHIKAQTEVVLIVGHLVHQRMKEMQLVRCLPATAALALLDGASVAAGAS